MARRNAQRRRVLCASELAEMGVCERRVRFAATLGRRMSEEQRLAAMRGSRAHAEFLHDAIVARPGRARGRCFIAMAVYGESAETDVLRQFRDDVLRSSRVGRGVILAYYRVAPSVCTLLDRATWLRGAVRTLLRPVVAVARIAVGPPK